MYEVRGRRKIDQRERVQKLEQLKMETAGRAPRKGDLTAISGTVPGEGGKDLIPSVFLSTDSQGAWLRLPCGESHGNWSHTKIPGSLGSRRRGPVNRNDQPGLQ